ncbi:thioredoxin family protein [Candidatus Carsonella ruddii]|uniref:thioredoxin family protein n=1 Tax=Carsonella ruddii TaxID=114186 RepID=UPI003D9A61FE
MIILKNNILSKINNKKKILIFFANWCFPCNILKKNIKKIEKKINVLFFLINIENHKEYCLKLGVKYLPTIIFDFKKKKILNGIITIKNILKEINNI